MNYSRISRLLSGGLACCFAWTWVACAAAEKEPGTPKPAILIIDKGPSFTEHWNPLVLQEMLDCGFEVGLRKDSKLTWEELKQFNMALLVEPPEGCAEKICPLLERFMNEGGGVLIVPFQALLGSANVTLLPVLRWLKPLGAAVYALGIEDPERKATIDWCKWPGQPEYIWTSEMADSPITKGVKNLWYPTGISCSSYLLSAPIEIDKNWKPIVFTGPDSYAVSWKEIPEKKSPIRFINLEDYGEFIIAKGKKQGRQPLLAVRDYGKGKLAVFAVFPRDFLWCGYIPALDGVVLRKGFHGRPSDGWQLLSNLYRYLAAPSMKSGNLGGYKTVRDRIFHKTLHAPVPYDWKTHKDLSKREARTSVPRGLVGAHTSYSTGTGTVAEWVKAAKAAKLDFLVFLEDFSQMNSEKWEKLKADCKAISDKDFLAFPALEFQLQLGDRGFILNRYMRWPPAGVFTRDGRKIDISRRDGENCGIFQLCMNTGQSDETKSKTTIAPNGFFSYKNNFIPTWDQRLANIFTVFSRDKKGTIDDCLPEYLVNQSQKLHVCPIAISLMYEPEEVLEAVENKWPYVTVLGLGDGKDIGRHIDYMGDYCYAGTVSSLCASTGPEILEWTYSYNNVSYNVPRWNVAKRENDFYVLNNYRYDVRLKAVSDKGLAEVIIYDGDKGVYRRFLLNGERTFDVTLDLVNNQCRHLVPVVKDIAGGVAVAREIQTESWLNRMYWCGDRCNFGSQPRGHGAGQLHPQPWTTQNGPYDQLLAQWSFPIVSPSVTEVRADFFRRFETAGGYSCMWHTYYRTWPMEEMNIQDTEISWRGIYGGDIFFWEEQWPAALDQIWNWPEPETPFYPENRSDFKEIAGLPKWKAQHNTREIRLLKDVAFQKPFVNALSVSNMYLSGWGSYDFRIGKQRVSGMFPGAGSPELKLSGKVPESGIFAVQVEPEDKGWIWSLTGKNMEYRLSAVDGEFSLEVGWPAAPKQSKKGVVYAQETYKLDGAFTGPKLDTLLKPDGIQPITGRLVSQRLPYTFIPENGACVFHLSEMFLPFKWIHVEVHGLDPHCTAYYTEIKTPKLLLYMPFEDKSASLTRDRSGNNFDGSVTGATWTSSGKFAGAYCFDGIGDRIDTGEDSAFDFVSGDFSVAMWARKKDNTSGYAISKGRSPGIFSWCLFWNHPVSAWQMYTTQGGGVQWGCSLDTWHHIVVTREGSQLKMYGDGVLRDSKSLGGNLSDKATNLTIGAEPGGGSHFKGCLDEIRIYGNALSEVQVKALYEMAVDEHEEIGGPWVLGNIRPVGVDPEGIARAVIWRGKKDMDVFMGHPVLCSDKEVFYDAILDSGGGWIIEANNPTDKDRTVDFRMHPAWKGNVRIEKTVTIPAGGRINFKEAPDDGKKTE